MKHSVLGLVLGLAFGWAIAPPPLLADSAASTLRYFAQSDTIAWDMQGVAVAVASEATYRVYRDGAPSITLTGVTCAAVSGVTACSAPRPPALPLGSTFTMTATLPGFSESDQSVPCTLPVPKSPIPTNLRYGG